MTRTGRIGAALTAFLLVLSAGYALEIETEIERDRVAVGQEAMLHVKIKDAGGADLGQLPNVPGLSITYRGISRSFQWINGVSWSGVVLNFAVEPQRSGRFTVPPIQFRIDGARYQSKAVTIIGVPGAPRQPGVGGVQREQAHRVLRQTVLSKARVYAGEPLLLRYYLLHTGINFDRAPVPQKLPETKFFVQHTLDEKSEDVTEKREGEEFVKTRLVTFLLIPTVKGRHVIKGGEVMISYVSEEGFFSFPRQAGLAMDSAEVEVLPLPETGRPDGFEGNVGSFTMDVEYDKKPVKVYDEVRIKAVVRGTGNFITLSSPSLEAPQGIKVIKGVNDAAMEVDKNSVKGTREFVFTLVPEKAGDIDAGPLRFSFFDPASGMYRTIVSEHVSLKVTGDSSGGGIGLDGGDTGAGMDVNYLWIALIVLAVAGMVAAVAVWERRKYSAFVASKKNSSKKTEERRADGLDAAALDSLHRDVVLSTKGSDPNEFLKTAERVLGRLMAPGAAESLRLSDERRKAITEMKERVYNIRYGGYAIGADEVKEMSGRLRELLRELRSAVK